MSYILIVIDMQPFFVSYKGALDGCIREVSQAINDNMPIMFVEYDSYGSTTESLLELVKNNKHIGNVYRVTKYGDNGAKEIIAAMSEHGLSTKKIKICGVNTDACVERTVSGLISKLDKCKIYVMSEACNSNFDHLKGLSRMMSMKNVFIEGQGFDV